MRPRYLVIKAVLLVLACPMAAIAADPPVYVFPEAPRCNPSSVQGADAWFAVLDDANGQVSFPWDDLVSALAQKPDDLATKLNLARCYYTFERGIAHTHLGTAEKLIAEALADVRSRGNRSGDPPAKPPLIRTHYQRPDYPQGLAELGISGLVVVELTIDKRGKVRAARIVGSNPKLDDMALPAVRQWTYGPVRIGGKATEVTRLVTLSFRDGGVGVPDSIDLAEFYSARGDQRDAEAMLADALRAVREERASVDAARDSKLMDGGSQARLRRLPEVLTRVEPEYTPDTLQACVQGTVGLKVLVRPDGRVGLIRIVQGLDTDLDEQARRAAVQWRFLPATDAEGTAVPGVANVQMEFRVRPGTDTTASGDVCSSTDPNNVRYRVPAGRPANAASGSFEDGVSLPTVTKRGQLMYTSEALHAKIQGPVHLLAIVEPDGRVGATVVAQSLDRLYGLDEAAIHAARQWRFVPCQKDNSLFVAESKWSWSSALG